MAGKCERLQGQAASPPSVAWPWYSFRSDVPGERVAGVGLTAIESLAQPLSALLR
jgi:hypothetical protein